MSPPVLKILVHEGCHTYVLGCPETREALLVDPKAGQEAALRDALRRYGLRPRAVLDTHTHADHLSAGPRFTAEGAELWMSARTACERPKRALADGDELTLGSLRLRVLELPGHTPDSLGLFGQGLVLCGDSLLVGGLARADFVGSDAAQLFDSVRARLLSLPDDTLVFPGHGYQGILFSTVGVERATNATLQHADGAAYAAQLDLAPGAGNTPDVDATLALNLAAEPELPASPGTVAACCAAGAGVAGPAEIREAAPEELHANLDALVRAGRWVDVRDPWEFEQAHIPGTRNLPLSELGFHLDELRGHEPLYLSCRSGVRSMTAARTLHHLGVAAEPVSVAGGILAWQEHGWPLEGLPVC